MNCLPSAVGLMKSLVTKPKSGRLVTQIVKLKLLELHLAIGFTKFFIKHNFVCRGYIKTCHDLLMENAELLNTVHSKNKQISCGRMLLFSDPQQHLEWLSHKHKKPQYLVTPMCIPINMLMTLRVPHRFHW